MSLKMTTLSVTLTPYNTENAEKLHNIEMAPSNPKHTKLFLLFLFILCVPLLFLTVNFQPPGYQIASNLQATTIFQVPWSRSNLPEWFKLIKEEINGRRVKVGLINHMENPKSYRNLETLAEIVTINLDPVPDTLNWAQFFPTTINSGSSCPKIPMPDLEKYDDLDVVVAQMPCGSTNNGKAGARDLLRLQVNLAAASLAAANGEIEGGRVDRTVHVVFVGKCGPMVEIFRCDELVMRVGDYWHYKANHRRLLQKVLMPVGSCQLASSYNNGPASGDERWRKYLMKKHSSSTQMQTTKPYKTQRRAYVTVLHSSERYVCGSITLAHSIKTTNTTADLVLLADNSVTNKSRFALAAAGWRIVPIQRIRSPHSRKGAYNEWNYSKLRIWQLARYEKIIFIDSDFVVLRNMDEFFRFPELSAAPNSRVLFNSGIMVLEPSTCMFEDLMLKTFELESYNGGDQGFLNEYFVWWHRLPNTVNYLKYFQKSNLERKVPDDLYAIHYLGTKPWMCGRKYDCNWDKKDNHVFASNHANEKWWEVYDLLPKELQGYCGRK